MNPLPQLPLVDNAFLIDNSSLEHFQACRRLYELQDIRKYSLSASRAGRNFGSCLHTGWKARYTNCDNNAPSEAQVAAVNETMQSYMMESPQPVDDFRSAAHACYVMQVYNQQYGNEPFKILSTPSGPKLVEKSFALPLGSVHSTPVIYTGRIDLAIENNDGIWTFDHKTTFQYGAGFEDEMSINGGQLGYVWALSQVLGTKPQGYIINGVRIRRPARTKKYEGAGEVAPVDSEDFKRIPMFVPQDALDEWQADVLALISDLFFNHDRSFFPRSRRSCVTKYGRCDMFEVCTAPRLSRQNILDSSLFVTNEWSPLNQTNKTSE